ncbi:MAG: DUF2971 domain-containing protein [Thiotrichales bacterium]|nr:DUF2971 domain-containing protein [Thiotrichales bacterium]
MYEEHPICQPPPDDAILWRYMDFTKFVSLLESQALFFCRADLLGDPFEGSISAVTPAAFPQNFSAGPEVAVHRIDLRQITRMMYVNCWHGGEFKSEAMWRLYAREHDGIAIKTIFRRFRDALAGDESVHVSRIQYRDYRTDSIPFGNGLLPCLHKRISFRHEQEVRVLTLHASEKDKPSPDGFYHKVNLEMLVEEIVVAPFTRSWFANLVRSLAGRYGLGDRVRMSELSDTPTFTAHFVASKA